MMRFVAGALAALALGAASFAVASTDAAASSAAAAGKPTPAALSAIRGNVERWLELRG
jgi:hypothetical protein